MAEQEACASAVTEALEAAGETVDNEEQSGERGESLLLPLLQGLLQGGGQRLLAGLGAASHDVVADVRRSLQRLRVALAPPNDHPQARALLALADRLEEALDAADRLDGCKRKIKRRSRTARHTVGVTREELEEARRIIDRDQLLPETVKTDTTNMSSNAVPTSSLENSSKRKSNTDISVHNPIKDRQKPSSITQNANYTLVPKDNIETKVVERKFTNNRKPDFFRHSIADAVKPEPSKSPAERWHLETKSSIAAIANKFNSKVQMEAATPTTFRRVPVNRPIIAMQQKSEEETKLTSFYRPPPPGYNFAAPQPAEDLSKPLNRFNNSKRNRMKRANTIDIGRPLGGYKIDSEDDENLTSLAPKVPEFQPQTENDRKFLAFMQKNESINHSPAVGQTNWSNRFGNIKNTFENREQENSKRASSASSAKRFWKTSDENCYTFSSHPRKFLADITPEVIKPPWTSNRRDSIRSQQTIPQLSPQSSLAPPIQSQNKSNAIKPFVAKPIPVNQFSHAPMSAFKPPQKIVSPTSAVPNIWSPPSSSIPVSPSVDYPPAYPLVLNPLSPSSTTNSFILSEVDKLKIINTPPPPKYRNDNELQLQAISQPKIYKYGQQPAPPTHVRPQAQNYPIKPIPSQNNLAAPELVKKLGEPKNLLYAPKLDAQQLQIEFYEKQIREKNRREESNECRDVPLHKPPPPPAPSVYTVVDYTPQNVPSTFVPLQQTPDIEKAKAHKIDYLPDVVMNENKTYECNTSPISRITPASPANRKVSQEQQNGNVFSKVSEDETATEHNSVVTRVMRGPVRGAATITSGIRTRHTEGAADNLRGVLDKLSSPKNEVMSEIEKKKQEISRNQVRMMAPQSIRPGLSPSHAPLSPRPSNAIEHDGYPRSPGELRSPALAVSRESVFSSESPASRGSSPGSALVRSGSWHRLGEVDPKSISPRRVVARTKSMHLLAIPKLFEGGIASEELPDKKRTVQAYFSRQADRQPSSRTSTPQVLPARNRSVRATQPLSFALGRSRTMPAVTEMQFLDESNADDAFEDLVSALA